MNKSSVSIVCLTLNNLSDLKKTLKSIEKLHDYIYELIIVDSSEGSEIEMYFSNFDAEFSKTYHWEKAKGIYPAMNTSLRLAQEDNFIWFLNPGDIVINSNVVIELIDKIVETKSDWGFAQTKKIIGSNIEIFPKVIGLISPKSIAYGVLSISHQSMLCKVKVILQIGGFDESYLIAADLKFQTLLAYTSTPVWIETPMVEIDPNGISHQKVFRTYLETFKVRWSCEDTSRLYTVYLSLRYVLFKFRSRLGKIK